MKATRKSNTTCARTRSTPAKRAEPVQPRAIDDAPLPPDPGGDAQKGREALCRLLCQIHEARIDCAMGLAAAVTELVADDELSIRFRSVFHVADRLLDTLQETKDWIDQVEEAAWQMMGKAGADRPCPDDDAEDTAQLQAEGGAA